MDTDPVIVGFIGTKDDVSSIVISPYIGNQKMDSVVTHESYHLSALDGILPPFEELSEILAEHGDDVERGAHQYYRNPQFGRCPEHPVPAETIYGELRYVKSLKSKNGLPLNVKRIGCVLSPATKYVVDCYRATSDDNTIDGNIFINPYCKFTSNIAPAGFALAEDPTDSEKNFLSSKSKIERYQREIEAILLAGPDGSLGWEEQKKHYSSLFLRMINASREFQYTSQHSVELMNFKDIAIKNLLPWMRLFQLEWLSLQQKETEAKELFNEIVSKPAPNSIHNKPDFDRRLEIQAKTYQEKGLLQKMIRFFS